VDEPAQPVDASPPVHGAACSNAFLPDPRRHRICVGAPPVTVAIPTLSALLLLVGVTLAWAALGRVVLPLREFLRLSLHAIEKLGFYHRMAKEGHVGLD
jgi:hypothetical protein